MKQNVFRMLLTGLLMFSCFLGYAQSAKVTGVVNDAAGMPLPGVNIMVKGTVSGTVTDLDGKYSVSVDNAQAAVLVYSFIGFRNQEIAVAGKSAIDVTMEDDAIGLDEVVAVGYGVVKKSDLTGSVSSVKADEIAKTSSSNAMQAMQAKVPGVDIQQSSGESGSGVNITMRGNRSITGSNSPLILVDGIEYGSTLDINPSDIESMEILKDASSTAIYGSKGANGVILISTKRGKAGKSVVTFNSFVSSNSATNVPKVMYGRKEVQRLIDRANYTADAATGEWGTSALTAEEVLTEGLEDFTEIGIYNDGSYTDWADLILQDGMTQNYELSVSGGNDKTVFNLSLGSLTEEGLLKNDQLQRYNTKANIDHSINDHIKVGANVLYTIKDHDKRNSSVFPQSMKMTTITHAYTEEGDIIKAPNPRYAAHSNPLLDEVDGAYQNNIKTTRFFGNAYLQISPIKDVVFKSTFALDKSNSRNGIYQDYESVARFQGGSGAMSLEYKDNIKYTWENTLNYMTDFDGSESDVNLLLGHSQNKSVNEFIKNSGDIGSEHYYQNAFYDVKKIAAVDASSGYTQQSMLSYFGRVNYKFKEKYLLTASMRADGSSTIAPGNQWGYFPSVAAAWRINQEGFMAGTQNWLSNLKLRTSWGKSGNSAIDPYQTLAVLGNNPVYYYVDGSDGVGKIPSEAGNSQLIWETTDAINLGIDFGVLNGRVSGSIDFFQSQTYDLLYFRANPPSEAYPSVIDNVAETKGQGIEVALNTLIVSTEDFSWDVNWSYSSYSDEVVKLSSGKTKEVVGQAGYIVGEQVSIYYDYEADGCWGTTEFEEYIADWQARNPDLEATYASDYGKAGSIKIVDRNDDGAIDDEDKKVYDRSPNHILGMNNTFTYKNFSLSVLLYARMGGYLSYGMNNQFNFESANWGDLDYWTVDNLDAKFPNPGTGNSSYLTSLMYEKADYVKIKDITLSYNLPKNVLSKVGIENCKVFGSLKNYFTFSDIENYDSERGGSINFPLAKQVVVGLNVQF